MTGDTYDEAFLATADGPRIHYRTYPAIGPKSGPAIICLHGLTRNERDFEDLAPRIAALGRRVIVPSQRGRGLSDRDKPERYNPQAYAGDMLALLDHLGVGKAIFVGTSMGGGITMVTAALAPQRLAGAVLNDVGPEIDPTGLARIRGFVGVAKTAANWREAAARCRDINGYAFPEETGDAFWLSFAREILREDSPGHILFDYDPAISASLGNTSDPLPNLWPLFEALKPIPTLVIRGGISDVLMPSTVDEMRRRKPDLHLVSLPAVGHAPFMTEPVAWAGLSAFIAGIR